MNHAERQLWEKSQVMMSEVELAYAKLQVLERSLQGAAPGSPQARFLEVVMQQLKVAEEALGFADRADVIAA